MGEERDMDNQWKRGWGSGKSVQEKPKVVPARMSVADGIRYRMLERQWAEESLLMVTLSNHQKKR